MIASNSRTPARVLGDIRALVVGGNMAGPRLIELCDKYGCGQVMEIIDELLDYTERLTRQGIERIPDGVYRGSYLIEDDGIDAGQALQRPGYGHRRRIEVQAGLHRHRSAGARANQFVVFAVVVGSGGCAALFPRPGHSAQRRLLPPDRSGLSPTAAW